MNESHTQVCLEPPHAHPKPAVSASIRARPEDFRVEEFLGFEPTGAGEHLYLEVRKREANTRWVAEQLARFFRSSVGLMQVLARACGHGDLASFCRDDITTWSREMADLSGIEFAGFDPAR